jgi:hypothetical protein
MIDAIEKMKGKFQYLDDGGIRWGDTGKVYYGEGAKDLAFHQGAAIFRNTERRYQEKYVKNYPMPMAGSGRRG